MTTPPSKFADEWCHRCETFIARHQDGYVCPVCIGVAVDGTRAARRDLEWVA